MSSFDIAAHMTLSSFRVAGRFATRLSSGLTSTARQLVRPADLGGDDSDTEDRNP